MTALSPLGRVAAADQTDTDPAYMADQAREHGMRHHHGWSHGLAPGTTADLNCGPCASEDRPRARYIHGDDGLANEYATSAIQVAAGLLASQYHQAKVHAEGDEGSVWAYLPDTWIASAAGVLAAVCRG